MRWRTFCAELLAIADKLNVDTVVILGRVAGRHPAHPPGAGLRGGLLPESATEFFGLEESRYEGPDRRGVPRTLRAAAGIPAVTFWAAVPRDGTTSPTPNPKATVALLRRVEDVLDIEVPLADLPAQAEEWVGRPSPR